MSLKASDPELHPFARLALLVGEQGTETLQHSHVLVLGLGGVGSWAAEALGRCGVGRLSLVDFDRVCPSNTNRQLPALEAGLIAMTIPDKPKSSRQQDRLSAAGLALRQAS